MSLTDQLQDILNSLGGFGPVIMLSTAFAGLMVVELLVRRRADARSWLAGLTTGTIIVATVWAMWQPMRGFLFMHLLFLDGQAIFYQVVIALAAVLVVIYERSTSKPANSLPLEWYPLLLALVTGLFLLTMSVNLLAIYLSLELVSICSYLLTGLLATRQASEGGLKYMLFGAVSSAVMLYGMSLLYGLTGTLDITSPTFGEGLSQNPPVVILAAGLLTGVGLLFKLSLVPFHVWTPDAYQAAPVPVVAFFSVAPKAGALLALMRFVSSLPGRDGAVALTNIQTPLAVIALASITLGNLSALWQTDAKRLLAYSTIAHAGFLLVGVVALNEAGFQAATFYIATYLPINVAAFFLIDQLAQANGGSLALNDLAGLGPRQPLLSVALTVVMIALVGLPPTVGFTAKLLAFSALYDAGQTSGNGWLLALFGLGLLNAVVSLFYYLKIPFLLFFRPISPDSELITTKLSPVSVALSVVLAALTVGLFLKPDWLLALIAGLR